MFGDDSDVVSFMISQKMIDISRYRLSSLRLTKSPAGLKPKGDFSEKIEV